MFKETVEAVIAKMMDQLHGLWKCKPGMMPDNAVSAMSAVSGYIPYREPAVQTVIDEKAGVAVFVTTEQIDCRCNDPQMRYTLYLIKDGDEQPKQILEDHSYEKREGNAKIQILKLNQDSVTVQCRKGERNFNFQGEEVEFENFAEAAKALISQVGACLGCDHTYAPVFPENRKDICAVRHLTENGSTYGYDTIYLVWKKPKGGKIDYRSITDSQSTKDYLDAKSVIIKDDEVVVDVSHQGEFTFSLKSLGLES